MNSTLALIASLLPADASLSPQTASILSILSVCLNTLLALVQFGAYRANNNKVETLAARVRLALEKVTATVVV